MNLLQGHTLILLNFLFHEGQEEYGFVGQYLPLPNLGHHSPEDRYKKQNYCAADENLYNLRSSGSFKILIFLITIK